MIAATTTIQAGFRGFHARQLLRTTPLTPGIVLHQPRGDSEDAEAGSSCSSSSYSYVYEDECDSEGELEARPDSPRTAIENYQYYHPLQIGGFRATFGIR